MVALTTRRSTTVGDILSAEVSEAFEVAEPPYRMWLLVRHLQRGRLRRVPV
jgi:hypothetical protein